MSRLRNTIYYEFYKDRGHGLEYLSMGTKVIGNTSIATGIDTIPTLTLTIPLEELPDEALNEIETQLTVEPRLQRYVIKVFFQVEGKQKYIFPGIVDSMTIDYAGYSVEIGMSHRVAEMRNWAMPVNYTVKKSNLSFILGSQGAFLGSPDGTTERVRLDYEGNSGDTEVSMTFGSNDKLAALSEALDNTEKLHFYVDLASEDRIVIGEFGDDSKVIISPYAYLTDDCDPEVDTANIYVTMLTEPISNIDYTNHFNRAIVFCGDVDYGVEHLTLRWLYENPAEQDPMFPVGKYEKVINQTPEPTEDEEHERLINNEKIYNNYEPIVFETNGNREFFVTDKYQLERDDNVVRSTTYRFSDLYPIPNLSKDVDEDGTVDELIITEEDRIEIVKQAYQRAIRKLKNNRPEQTYQMNITALPETIKEGQKITFQYTKKVKKQNDDECDVPPQEVTIVNLNTSLFLTKRTIVFDDVMNEYATVSLDNELRTKDISATEIELLNWISGKQDEESSDENEAGESSSGTGSTSGEPNRYDIGEDKWRLT